MPPIYQPELAARAIVYAAGHPRRREFHDHVRIESLFFDGTLDPKGGSITRRRHPVALDVLLAGSGRGPVPRWASR